MVRLLQELLGVVDGDGERDARSQLHRVDPDGLAVEVQLQMSRLLFNITLPKGAGTLVKLFLLGCRSQERKAQYKSTH